MGKVTITDEAGPPATPADGETLYSVASELRYIDEAGTVHRVLTDNNLPLADAITSAMLADDAVTTDKINNFSVTAAKLATSAVETAKIADLNVTTAKIANDAVTAGKIADNVIGESYLVGVHRTIAATSDAIDTMDARIDNLVLNTGVSSAEVVDARSFDTDVATEATLRARLNHMEGNYFDVVRFGAAGDGVTDDATSIAAALLAAQDASALEFGAPVLYFPPGYHFYTTGQMVTGAEINVIMESPVYYAGATFPAIQIGTSGVNCSYKHFKVWLLRSSYSDFTADAAEEIIGVSFLNVRQSEIEIKLVMKFTVNVVCESDVAFVYNTIYINRILDGKIGLWLRSTAIGYCNENLFIGGSFALTSTACAYATNENNVMEGVRIGASTTDYGHNKNTFLKPSFELQYDYIVITLSGSGGCIPVRILSGAFNTFYDCRIEKGDPVYAMRCEGENTHLNRFEHTYNYGIFYAVDDQTTTAANVAAHGIFAPLFPRSVLVFDSGFVAQTACYYDGATKIHVPGMHTLHSSETLLIDKAKSGFTINADYLEANSSSGLGVYLDTTNVKRFVLACDEHVSARGTWRCIAFNSAGDVLDGTAPKYVESVLIPNYDMDYPITDTWGHAYYRGTSGIPLLIRVHDDVTKLFVAYSDGYLKRMQIYALGDTDATPIAPAYVTYEPGVPGANIGTAAPTAGTWAVGRRVWNVAPAAGGTEGWVCTAAGTPGTWKAFGAIAA